MSDITCYLSNTLFIMPKIFELQLYWCSRKTAPTAKCFRGVQANLHTNNIINLLSYPVMMWQQYRVGYVVENVHKQMIQLHHMCIVMFVLFSCFLHHPYFPLMLIRKILLFHCLPFFKLVLKLKHILNNIW